jgi:hypothetical protein
MAGFFRRCFTISVMAWLKVTLIGLGIAQPV